MSPGTIDPSSESSSVASFFDHQTETIPETIGGAQPEILPPAGAAGAGIPETGWAVDDLGNALSLTFFLLSKRLGEHWELDDDEANRFGRAWKPILDRYCPTNESIWAAPVVATLAIVGSRAIQTDWKKEKQPDKKPQQTASTAMPASGESPLNSGKEAAANQLEWDPFSESRSA